MERAKRTIAKRALWGMGWLVGAQAIVAPLGCAVGAEEQSELGTLRMSLTGTGVTGTTYRLRFADFTVEGPTSTSFSTETDPNASSILVDLAAGDYSLTLLDGWVLERQSGMEWEAVEAELTSPNPASFQIIDQTLTGVVVQFSTDGDTVSLGEGTLEVRLGVDDAVCEAGTASCDGDEANGCETSLSSDVNHCGACESACSTVPGASPTCIAGMCGTECLPSRADCDMSSATGCETNTATSLQHCGACGNSCMAPNAQPVCQGGLCAIAQCTPGFSNCDLNFANGCEVLNDTNPACAQAASLGSISGDTGAGLVTAGDIAERRFQIQVTENDNGAAARDLGVRITLTSPPGASYRLEAACDGCGVQASSANQVTLRWPEQTVLGIPTTNSSRPVFVNVVYVGGTSCQPWQLQVAGNFLSGPVTCSAL